MLFVRVQVRQLFASGVALVLAAACVSPEPGRSLGSSGAFLVIENRTESAVSMGPLLTIGPCSRKEESEQTLSAITAETSRRIKNGELVEVPPGTVDFSGFELALPSGADLPIVLVSSASGNSVF
jgi:hypothetical protein